ncbi:MAG: TadE/TadG family type IV pilus assembly protein [bacterium]|nr:TadE/TadG family type IV pilus assembly protein [bacterium]
MRNFLRKAIKFLDGTPQPRRRKKKNLQRGQSVLEMTLITPLLIILLVGLVEIGWFARNYLTLLEVTRVGARRGAVLGGDNSPLVWNEWASLPRGQSYDPLWANYPLFPDPPNYGGLTQSNINNLRVNVRDCSALGDTARPDNFTGFYNLVLCQMLASLSPLQIRYDPALPVEERTDDIVISVFSIQLINNNVPTVGGDELRLPNGIIPNEFQDGYIPVVVGRYPTKANECNYWRDPANPGTPIIFHTERDPFDFYRQGADQSATPGTNLFLSNSSIMPNENQFLATYYVSLFGNKYNDFLGPSATNGKNGGVDVVEVSEIIGGVPTVVGRYPLELAVLRDGIWVSPGDLPAFDPYNYPEMVRGFAYTGYHQVNSTVDRSGTLLESLCFGSEFSVQEIQNLLVNNNFFMSQQEIDAARLTDPNFAIQCEDDGSGGTICSQDDVRRYMANQGIVMVEIFWQHRLLLDIPVFSPIYNFLGSDRTTISVWSAFPAPSAVPNLKFNQDVDDFLTTTTP